MDESSSGNWGIDARVGGLVWVRRRNGSWWPGRIMGMEELPESCLVSPRSGTPVKLLGREDGSIDWYNLERSKRVKSFRCGEYEDAIEKAKAAAANLSKKAVKYARREDAILHALRLESSCLGKEENGIPIADPVSEQHTDSNNYFTLTPELSQSSLSFQEPSLGTRRRSPYDSTVEECPRMKVLEDLACIGNNPMNGFKDHSLPLKRKRSQLAVVHDYLKRKDRCRPLTKVLESTAMLSVPISSSDQTECPKWSSPAASLCKIGGEEFHKCNGNGTIIVDMTNFNGSPMDNWEHAPHHIDGVDDNVKANESECPSEFPENEEFETFLEAPSFLDDENSMDLQPAEETGLSHLNGHSLELNQVHPSFLLSDGFPESSPCSAAVHTPTAERGASEWSSKGKRNSRQLARKQSPLKYFNSKEEPNIQSSLPAQQSPPPHPSSKTDEHTVGSSGSDSGLYDVDLEVKAGSHRPSHVPLVSLMSKLNGKAVIGHPLSVEVLDDVKSDVPTNSSARDTICIPIHGASENANKKPKDHRFSSRKSKKRKRQRALSKKMRKLSSLSGGKGRSLSTVGPVVSCIPVQLVFSRITEAVNGSTRSWTSTPTPTNKV